MANPNTPVTDSTPTAGINLRPVDIGSRKPWGNILAIFARAAGRQDTLSVRAPGKDGDLNTALGVGYYNLQGQALRGAAAGPVYDQGKRAQMAPLPTPQALLRQVTGIGDPVQGR